MTKSEIDWRLSDAPDIPKKDDVQSITEHASARPNTDNPQQEAEPIPIVEIRYPKGIEDDARATNADSNAEIGGSFFLRL
jgi:hypothetical protein